MDKGQRVLASQVFHWRPRRGSCDPSPPQGASLPGMRSRTGSSPAATVRPRMSGESARTETAALHVDPQRHQRAAELGRDQPSIEACGALAMARSAVICSGRTARHRPHGEVEHRPAPPAARDSARRCAEVALHRHSQQVDRAEKARDEIRPPGCVDAGGRARLAHRAGLEHQHAVSEEQRLLLVMRDHHRRHARLGLDLLQFLPHLLPHFPIERGERLVEQAAGPAG